MHTEEINSPAILSVHFTMWIHYAYVPVLYIECEFGCLYVSEN